MKREILQSEQGVTLVEFSVTLLVFLVLAFGIVEFGSMIHERNTITHMAREGASLASRNLTDDGEILDLMVASSSPLNFQDTPESYRMYLANVDAGTAGNPNPTCTVQERGTLTAGGITSPDADPNCDLTDELFAYLQYDAGLGTAPVESFTVVKVYYAHVPHTPLASLLNMPFFGGSGTSDFSTLMRSTAIF